MTQFGDWSAIISHDQPACLQMGDGSHQGFQSFEAHRFLKSLLTSDEPVSGKIYEWTPYGRVQLSKIIVAKSIDNSLAVGIAQVTLEYIQVIITTCWIPDEVFRNRSKI